MATDYSALLTCHTHAIIRWTTVIHEPWHEKLPVHPLVPNYLRSDTDVCPVLLALDETNDAQKEQLYWNLVEAAKNPDKHLFASLLNVPPQKTTKSLIHHLTDKVIMNAHSPPGKKLLIYYYMSYVFPHLWRILPDVRIRQLFGFIQAWTIPFQNKWTTFAPPQTTEGIPQYWAAGEQQVENILRIGLINQVLENIRKPDTPWASLEDFHTEAEKIDRALIHARQHYQMQDKDDLIAFGEHTIQYGADFHHHPKIQALLTQTVEKKGWGYAPESLKLTEEDWLAIQRPAS